MDRRQRFWRVVYYSGSVGCALTLVSLNCILCAVIWPGPPTTRIQTRGWAEFWIGVLLAPSLDRRFGGLMKSWMELYAAIHALLLLAIGSLTAVARSRSRPRRPRGFCGNCGYSLTGNVSGRCPECGEAAGPQQRTS